jgi:transcription elongation factor Elf1
MDSYRNVVGDVDRFLSCPKCNAVAARADSLGRSIVYLVCGACGETWTIAERRKTTRADNRTARFSQAPSE